MQAFMQSLQMRWPVAATSGLSTAAMASAPMEKPSLLRRFISEIFSSSGQPARVTPNGDFWNAPVLRSRRPRELQARDAVHDFRLDRHEMFEVELVRHLEQRPVAMTLLALGIMECPGGVARQRLDRRRRRLDLEVGA